MPMKKPVQRQVWTPPQFLVIEMMATQRLYQGTLEHIAASHHVDAAELMAQIGAILGPGVIRTFKDRYYLDRKGCEAVNFRLWWQVPSRTAIPANAPKPTRKKA